MQDQPNGRRDPETGRKRGWFAPVVLLMLTVSVMGNVFFYSGRLHETQSRKVEEGLAIIRSQEAAKTLFAEAEKGLAELLRSDRPDTRAGALFGLGLAFGRSADVTGLIGQAAAAVDGRPAGEGDEEAAAAAEAAVDAVKRTLADIAAGTQPLAENERACLSALHALAAQLAQSAAALETEFKDRDAAMQARAGGPWVAAAREWGRLLEEAGRLKLSP